MSRNFCFTLFTVSIAAFGVGSLAVYATMPPAVAQVHRPAVAELPDTIAAPAKPRPGRVYEATVYNVVDGDTLDVEITETIRVRLLHCWCPEKTGPTRDAGMAAHRNLIKLAAGKDCVVEIPMTHDVKKSLSLDRFLGRVWIVGDEVDLSTQQVRSGFAKRTKAGK